MHFPLAVQFICSIHFLLLQARMLRFPRVKTRRGCRREYVWCCQDMVQDGSGVRKVVWLTTFHSFLVCGGFANALLPCVSAMLPSFLPSFVFCLSFVGFTNKYYMTEEVLQSCPATDIFFGAWQEIQFALLWHVFTTFALLAVHSCQAMSGFQPNFSKALMQPMVTAGTRRAAPATTTTGGRGEAAAGCESWLLVLMALAPLVFCRALF